MDLMIANVCISSSNFIFSAKLDSMHKIDTFDIIFSCIHNDLK
jgi:hypothetical protein